MVLNEKKQLLLNWKTNRIEEIDSLIQSLKALQCHDCVDVTLFPPPFYISSFSKEETIRIGTPHAELEPIGGSTASLSLDLLSSFKNLKSVMVGHAEVRRRGLSQLACQQLAQAAMAKGFTPIFCFGEEKGQPFEEVLSQLQFLKGVAADKYLLAYEPIWAIGASEKPSLDSIESRVEQVKRYLGDQQVKVSYGGSVDEKCFIQFFKSPFISGLLLGRMSHSLEKITGLLEEL